jgi:hypothetical protein
MLVITRRSRISILSSTLCDQSTAKPSVIVFRSYSARSHSIEGGERRMSHRLLRVRSRGKLRAQAWQWAGDSRQKDWAHAGAGEAALNSALPQAQMPPTQNGQPTGSANPGRFACSTGGRNTCTLRCCFTRKVAFMSNVPLECIRCSRSATSGIIYASGGVEDVLRPSTLDTALTLSFGSARVTTMPRAAVRGSVLTEPTETWSAYHCAAASHL